MPDTLAIGINTANAPTAAGSYTATITLVDVTTSSDTTQITVTLNVAAPLTACSSPVAFTYANGVATAGQTCALSDTGSGHTYTSSFAYVSGGSANWLTGATINTATALPGSLSLGIGAGTSALAAGSYSATITVTDSDTSVATVTVNLTVVAPITACSGTLTFNFANGVNTPSQPCSISSAAGHTYTVTSVQYDAASIAGGWVWLTTITPAAMPDNHSISIISATAQNMTAGAYSATVTLTDSDTSVATLVVNLNVGVAITVSHSTVSFNYTKGTTPTIGTVNVTDGGTNSYTKSAATYSTTVPASTQWLTISQTGTSPGHTPDVLTFTLTAAAATLEPSITPYTAAYTLTDTADNSTTTVTVSMTVLSPLSVVPPGTITPAATYTTTLTYSQATAGGGTASSAAFTILNSDASTDSYVVSKPACPSWLDVVSSNGSHQASSSASDTLTVSIDASEASVSTLPPNTGCQVTLAYNSATFFTLTLTNLNVIKASLLSSATAAIPLTYYKGGTGTNITSGTTNLTAPASFIGGLPFAVNVATVPNWLTVSPTNGTATTNATLVTFTLNTSVAAGMTVGNYTANVNFTAGGFAPVVVPVALSVQNDPATISLQEGATGSTLTGVYTWGSGPAPNPIPTVTPFSSDEPLSFSAYCGSVSVTPPGSYLVSSNSCKLNGSVATAAAPITGIAYTWGTQLKVSFESTIFSLPIGTVLSATITVTPATQGATPLTLTYTYTFQPADPTVPTTGAVVPASVAQIASGSSMVVLLNGTNFYGPQDIVQGGPVADTQVFLTVAGVTTAVPASQITVIGTTHTQMYVTIPQTSFPAPSASDVNIGIGVANQSSGATAPVTPKATANLKVTNLPVIYAITSTASYTNPGLGVNPSLAPFELISIFGDNFGFTPTTTPSSATGTLNGQQQYPTTLPLPLASVNAKETYLSVTFTDSTVPTKVVTYNAPILFANENQINAIMPSLLTVGHTVSVTVTSGAKTNVSGSFPINVVQNDPGIFTLTSDGTGQAAIVNQDGNVNSTTDTAEPVVGHWVSIYMTGLGALDSTQPDVAISSTTLASTALPFPTDCSALTLPTSKNGYLQIANTDKTATGWTVPGTAWSSIDGAVIQPELLMTNVYAPCMTDTVTVTFGSASYGTGIIKTATTGVLNQGVIWAGFSPYLVAGLYQVNVLIPTGAPTGPAVPVTVTIGSNTSQSGVTMVIQ